MIFGRRKPRPMWDKAFDLFITTYVSKDAAWLYKDREELIAFYDFLVQHRQRILTSNLIDLIFGAIHHRNKRSKGSLSRDGMLHVVSKLGQCSEKKWRRFRGDYLIFWTRKTEKS